MNKAQFIEILSNFIDSRLVEALAEQAEDKGYFGEEVVGKVILIKKRKFINQKEERSEQVCIPKTVKTVRAIRKDFNGDECSAPKMEASEQIFEGIFKYGICY